MTSRPAFKVPRHLRPATRRWAEEIVSGYELESHHFRLLVLACEAWDRGQQARVVLDRDGLTFEDRHKVVRPRPEVAIERDSRIAFARLLRELGLDVPTPADASRPPRIGRTD